ncbi:unnamed protein product [Ranitomeya imitator]|uniref:Uncharacterized protein n=1 Tax=Ranitomeya imitator TaxID=111125 RepID=A0ABN9MC76_9NEOB|nr:unnamed protein product [Ranitomeya imitator]
MFCSEPLSSLFGCCSVDLISPLQPISDAESGKKESVLNPGNDGSMACSHSPDLSLQVYQVLREELAKAKSLNGIIAVNKELKLRCQGLNVQLLILYTNAVYMQIQKMRFSYGAQPVVDLHKITNMAVMWAFSIPFIGSLRSCCREPMEALRGQRVFVLFFLLRPKDVLKDEGGVRGKRALEDEEDGNAEHLSKNKQKKKLRNPIKTFDSSVKPKYAKCDQCGNPKGNKCVFHLCRSCCKKKAFRELADCAGHGLLFKTKSERALQCKAVQNADVSEENLTESKLPQPPPEIKA